MKTQRKIRYAVAGLGYISQAAVLPAFQHAEKNSELVALISDDPIKLKELGKKYQVEETYSYEEYELFLRHGGVDAIYIALPNSMHASFAVRAAEAGVHVLCEKPMAVTQGECEAMIEAANRNKVKLMIAYRLHFEKSNLKAIETARSGKLGELRIFNSLFTMQVKEGNIRLKKSLGGGTLYDIGIYCINAARNLFQDEPMEVTAITGDNGDKRFLEVDEMTGCVLRFPGERLATFVSSFGASDVSYFELVGTKGSLRVDRGYEMVDEMSHSMKTERKKRNETHFKKSDQFAPELLYFSDCILHHREPEPSGWEGLADVRVIEALYESAKTAKSVALEAFDIKRRPRMDQEIRRPPVKKLDLVHAESPSR